jgi:hypothetical protein
MSVPAAAPSAASFHIAAAADPGLLPRILALVAKRGLIPNRLSAIHPSGSDDLAVEMVLADLPAAVADHIARCIAVLPGVIGVER